MFSLGSLIFGDTISQIGSIFLYILLCCVAVACIIILYLARGPISKLFGLATPCLENLRNRLEQNQKQNEFRNSDYNRCNQIIVNAPRRSRAGKLYEVDGRKIICTATAISVFIARGSAEMIIPKSHPVMISGSNAKVVTLDFPLNSLFSVDENRNSNWFVDNYGDQELMKISHFFRKDCASPVYKPAGVDGGYNVDTDGNIYLVNKNNVLKCGVLGGESFFKNGLDKTHYLGLGVNKCVDVGPIADLSRKVALNYPACGLYYILFEYSKVTIKCRNTDSNCIINNVRSSLPEIRSKFSDCKTHRCIVSPSFIDEPVPDLQNRTSHMKGSGKIPTTINTKLTKPLLASGKTDPKDNAPRAAGLRRSKRSVHCSGLAGGLWVSYVSVSCPDSISEVDLKRTLDRYNEKVKKLFTEVNEEQKTIASTSKKGIEESLKSIKELESNVNKNMNSMNLQFNAAINKVIETSDENTSMFRMWLTYNQLMDGVNAFKNQMRWLHEQNHLYNIDLEQSFQNTISLVNSAFLCKQSKQCEPLVAEISKFQPDISPSMFSHNKMNFEISITGQNSPILHVTYTVSHNELKNVQLPHMPSFKLTTDCIKGPSMYVCEKCFIQEEKYLVLPEVIKELSHNPGFRFNITETGPCTVAEPIEFVVMKVSSYCLNITFGKVSLLHEKHCIERNGDFIFIPGQLFTLDMDKVGLNMDNVSIKTGSSHINITDKLMSFDKTWNNTIAESNRRSREIDTLSADVAFTARRVAKAGLGVSAGFVTTFWVVVVILMMMILFQHYKIKKLERHLIMTTPHSRLQGEIDDGQGKFILCVPSNCKYNAENNSLYCSHCDMRITFKNNQSMMITGESNCCCEGLGQMTVCNEGVTKHMTCEEVGQRDIITNDLYDTVPVVLPEPPNRRKNAVKYSKIKGSVDIVSSAPALSEMKDEPSKIYPDLKPHNDRSEDSDYNPLFK